MEVFMEEKHIDESIRQQASNYLYIPELKNSEVVQVIANRNQHSKPQGGKYE
jgi:predicted transposase YdaD